MTLDELFTAASDRERAERAKRGLPPAHVLDMAEFPFKFAVPELDQFADAVSKLIANEPGNLQARLFGACVSAVKGDYAAADAMLTALMPLTKSPFALMRFASLIDRTSVPLPAVTGAWPSEPALFLSCDNGYLAKYGMPLLRSLASVAPGCPVHVHIIGEKITLDNLALKLTITSEPPPQGFAIPDYYGAIRLVRFAEALEKSGAPLIMMDADGLVTTDPRPLLARDMPVALRVRAGRIEPWHQFSACLVGGASAGLPYFKRVAEIVRRSIDKSFWGLDQYALFSAYVQMRPDITLIGPDIAGVNPETPGTFWFTAGNEKKNLAASDTPYARLYRSFANV